MGISVVRWSGHPENDPRSHPNFSDAFAYFFRLKASLIFFLFLAPGRSSTKQ